MMIPIARSVVRQRLLIISVMIACMRQFISDSKSIEVRNDGIRSLHIDWSCRCVSAPGHNDQERKEKEVMTNYVRFFDKLNEIWTHGAQFGVDVNGEPVMCSQLECRNCDFENIRCELARKNWLQEDADIKASKLRVDTKLLCQDTQDCVYRGYFAKLEDGKIYVFEMGQTSWSNFNGVLHEVVQNATLEDGTPVLPE